MALPGADLESLDGLRDWNAALSRFRDEAIEALAAVRQAINSAHAFVGDQFDQWRHRRRLAEEELAQAVAELRNRKFPDAAGRMPDTALQERNVARAEAKIEYIDDRIKLCRRWGSHLEREIREVYEAGGVRFGAFLDGDLAQALNRLAAQIQSVEQYLNVSGPTGGGS